MRSMDAREHLYQMSLIIVDARVLTKSIVAICLIQRHITPVALIL